MPFPPARSFTAAFLAVLIPIAWGCSGSAARVIEYEEDVVLSLDGSATINVNASIQALVALRGAHLDSDPHAWLDRDRLRALFEAPGVRVSRLSVWRRDTRRFVQVSLDIEDVRRASHVAPLAWSVYRFDRHDETLEFRQTVGAPAGSLAVPWATGRELVRFRVHAPSRIPFHNAPSGRIERGNILTWEQPLRERLKGAPVEIHVQLETESILATTLLLFGATVAAAALTIGLLLWCVARRGRDCELAESRS
jgi:hypothetical protein